MIIIYNDEKEIEEMFDTAKEFKYFLSQKIIDVNAAMREDGCPEEELINKNNFHDQVLWLTNMDYTVEIK